MSDGTLPNFLLCGAAKSGTTTLHAMLGAHPDVFMSTPKEPHFFVRHRVVGRVPELVDDVDAYRALFQPGYDSKRRGEASVFYLYYHEHAVREILRYVGPEMQIAIVLRNPVDRAYSAWLQARKYNRDENLDFEAALDAEPQRIAEARCSPMLFYTDCGFYSAMVESYTRAFPRTRVFLFDDLEKDPSAFADSLFAFLGLSADDSVPVGDRRNKGGKAWSSGLVGQAVKALATPGIRRAGKRFLPGAYEVTKHAVTGRLMSPAEPMQARTRERLCRLFENDIRILEGRIARDLGHWIEPAAET